MQAPEASRALASNDIVSSQQEAPHIMVDPKFNDLEGWLHVNVSLVVSVYILRNPLNVYEYLTINSVIIVVSINLRSLQPINFKSWIRLCQRLANAYRAKVGRPYAKREQIF